MLDLTSHWNKAYQGRPTEELGWFEAYPLPSLELIEECELDKDARQLHVGVGSSTLIDRLVAHGYSALLATDLSIDALTDVKDRLGEQSDQVEWIVDDLTSPEHLLAIEPVDLWHDRAVLHFFTEEKDRQTYFDLLKKLVKPEGYVIIAEFNKSGAEKCNGLPVHRYDSDEIAAYLGDDFELINAFDLNYVNPRGEDRPYVYTLFKRLSA